MSRCWVRMVIVLGWAIPGVCGEGAARQPGRPQEPTQVLAAPPPARDGKPGGKGGDLPMPRPVDREGPDKARDLPMPRSVPGQALLPGDVLASADRHFPLLLAVLHEQGIASGQLLAAQGAFDLNLRAREFWQVGTFDSQRITVGVDQNLACQGISYFAGYRHSLGQFPIYYGDRKTGEGGEFRAGVLIPLLAGRVIDPRRARAAQAEVTRNLADPIVAQQRVDVLRAAARAYWTWVGVGRRYEVARDVLRIAERRDRQLAELVEKGQVAAIERTDNQRVIIERQARVVAAERSVQQAAIVLSLYLRDEAGNPQLPAFCRLPDRLPEPVPWDQSRVAKHAAMALEVRPELARLRLQRERVRVELELAKNLLLPGVNLGLEGYQDFGFGSAFSKTPLVKNTQLDRTTYIASLQLDLPLQRREAKGRVLAAEATLAQLLQQERMQHDRIVAEIQDAASALGQTYELYRKAREGLTVARKVEEAETERFRQGQGTLLILNLRELVTAEASFAEVDASAEYQRALADYRAALGVDATLPPASAAPCPPAAPPHVEVAPGRGATAPR